MNQTAKTFLALALVATLSIGSILISQYVQNEPERTLVKEGKMPARSSSRGSMGGTNSAEELHSELTNTVKKLEEELEKEPENLDKKLELANAYFQEGLSLGQASFLKMAAGLYNEIVEKDDSKSDALLGLATLSLHVGVFEKAIEYYEKYIKIKPDDLSAQSNLALAKGRNGDVKGGLGILESVLKKDSKFVIALVTKALLLKESGKGKEAEDLLTKASELEENPSLKARIDELKQGSSQKINPHSSNKLDMIKAFFLSHPILKNKFVKLEEVDASIKVSLKDFPIESMPPFAKETLTQKIKGVLKETGYKELSLLDLDTNNELMKIDSK